MAADQHFLAREEITFMVGQLHNYYKSMKCRDEKGRKERQRKEGKGIEKRKNWRKGGKNDGRYEMRKRRNERVRKDRKRREEQYNFS